MNREIDFDFEDVTLRLKYSSRGGGIEIDLSDYGYEDKKMTSYQNYLGGGMLGSIGNDCTIPNWKEDSKLIEISENLNYYFHQLTNEDKDEWSGGSYEDIQNRSMSSY